MKKSARLYVMLGVYIGVSLSGLSPARAAMMAEDELIDHFEEIPDNEPVVMNHSATTPHETSSSMSSDMNAGITTTRNVMEDAVTEQIAASVLTKNVTNIVSDRPTGNDVDSVDVNAPPAVLKSVTSEQIQDANSDSKSTLTQDTSIRQLDIMQSTVVSDTSEITTSKTASNGVSFDISNVAGGISNINLPRSDSSAFSSVKNAFREANPRTGMTSLGKMPYYEEGAAKNVYASLYSKNVVQKFLSRLNDGMNDPSNAANFKDLILIPGVKEGMALARSSSGAVKALIDVASAAGNKIRSKIGGDPVANNHSDEYSSGVRLASGSSPGGSDAGQSDSPGQNTRSNGLSPEFWADSRHINTDDSIIPGAELTLKTTSSKNVNRNDSATVYQEKTESKMAAGTAALANISNKNAQIAAGPYAGFSVSTTDRAETTVPRNNAGGVQTSREQSLTFGTGVDLVGLARVKGGDGRVGALVIAEMGSKQTGSTRITVNGDSIERTGSRGASSDISFAANAHVQHSVSTFSGPSFIGASTSRFKSGIDISTTVNEDRFGMVDGNNSSKTISFPSSRQFMSYIDGMGELGGSGNRSGRYDLNQQLTGNSSPFDKARELGDFFESVNNFSKKKGVSYQINYDLSDDAAKAISSLNEKINFGPLGGKNVALQDRQNLLAAQNSWNISSVAVTGSLGKTNVLGSHFLVVNQKIKNTFDTRILATVRRGRR